MEIIKRMDVDEIKEVSKALLEAWELHGDSSAEDGICDEYGPCFHAVDGESTIKLFVLYTRELLYIHKSKDEVVTEECSPEMLQELGGFFCDFYNATKPYFF